MRRRLHFDAADQSNCIDADECASTPCLHGGACIDSASGAAVAIGAYACACSGGNYGEHCEHNACDGIDCGDHGTCASGSCDCDEGWLGARCRFGQCTDLACETAALVAFNRSGSGVAAWNATGNPCADNWAGVTCDADGGTVVGLSLRVPAVCACSGATNGGNGGADCTSSMSGSAYCYTESGVCLDGHASNSVEGGDYSYAACDRANRRPIVAISPSFTGDLTELIPLTGLQTLELPGTGVTGTLSFASAMAALAALDLGGCVGVAGDLHALAGIPLGSLDLHSTSVRGDVQELQGLPLGSLDLADTAASGSVQALTSLPLEHLRLGGTDVPASSFPVVTFVVTFAGAESGCAYSSVDDRACDAVVCEWSMSCAHGACTCGGECGKTALLAFKQSGNGVGLESWEAAGGPCNASSPDWYGVARSMCHDGAVIELRLSGSNHVAGLAGDIGALGHLESLNTLDMTSDLLFGDLSGLAGLTGIVQLSLVYSYNTDHPDEHIAGDLSSLAGMTSLTYLALRYLRAITGDLSSLAGLVQLTQLELNGEEVTGDLSVLAGLPALTVLSLQDMSHLTGDIGTLSGLTGMTEVWVPCRGLTGDLSALSGMTNMTLLSLYGASAVTGSLADVAGMTTLINLMLFGTAITGDVGALASCAFAGDGCLFLGSSVTGWPLRTTTSHNCTFVDADDHDCVHPLCAEVACQNDGSCVVGATEETQAWCACTEGYSGAACETCDFGGAVTDLATLVSPYTGDTSGSGNIYELSCGGDGNEAMFSTELQPGQAIDIGMDSNSYDSRHETSWGGSCPGQNVVTCTDSPDTLRH